MGCGVSSQRSRADDYELQQGRVALLKDDKGSPHSGVGSAGAAGGVDATPRGGGNGAACLPGHAYTLQNLVMTHRKILKYADLPDDAAASTPATATATASQDSSSSPSSPNGSPRSPAAPDYSFTGPRKQLWELITGQRRISRTPGAVAAVVYTDFGKVGLGLKPEEVEEVEAAETAVDVTALLAKRSQPVAVKHMRVQLVRGHPKSIRVAALSPNDWLLVSTDASIGSSESSARVTDIRQEVTCGALDGRRKECFDSAVDACFTVDGSMLATVHRMESVLLWDMNTFRVKKTLVLNDDDLGEVRMVLVRISPDGKLVAVGIEMFDDEGGTNGCIAVYELNSKNSLLCKLSEPQCAICSLSFSPNGRMLVSGTHLGCLAVWDARSGVLFNKAEAHATAIRGLGFTANGTRIISCDERTVAAWDAVTLQPVWTRLLGTADPFSGVSPKAVLENARKNPAPRARHTCGAVAPGGLAVVAKTDRTLQFLRVSDGTEYSFLTMRSPVTKVSAGCKCIAVGDLFGNLYIIHMF